MQFDNEGIIGDEEILKCIPKLISDSDNQGINDLPIMEEIKKVVFGINGDSSRGLDRFTGCFYQHCWKVVGEDIERMVRSFDCGYQLPRYITHTNLVLVPKMEKVRH